MTSKKPPDFRPFISHLHPKIANCQGLDAHQHAAAALHNPVPRDHIIKPWSQLHIHTIVRTPNGNDYGIDLLRLHYEHAHGAGHQSDCKRSSFQ
jgi:hypothetical protein